MITGAPRNGQKHAESISVTRIGKVFGRNRVLDDVHLTIGRGSVHALLGANGSGKSTLVKILSGVYQPDDGQISIRGQTVREIGSPTKAHALGVRVVHQESPLVHSLTVAECFALFRTYPTSAYGRIRWPLVRVRAQESLDRVGVRVDAGTPVRTLSSSARALVALAIALDDIDSRDVSVLILDEATAPIPAAEASAFLTRVRALANDGLPILMVTHRLGEVEEIADDLTILADGRVVYQDGADRLSPEQMVEAMVARNAHQRSPALNTGSVPTPARRADRGSRPALAVEGIASERIEQISFSVAKGEILGFVGGPESGVDDLPLLLAGLTRSSAGTIEVDGVRSGMPRSPRDALRLGIALVPNDRLRFGAAGSLSVRDNILLPNAGRYWHRRRDAHAAVARVIQGLNVLPSDPTRLVRELSGGNQQRVIIGKWLLHEPNVLILHDPTFGIDPGARQMIFERIRRSVDSGLSVLLFSSEPQQLVEHCARILVIDDGVVTHELRGTAVTYEDVSRLAVA